MSEENSSQVESTEISAPVEVVSPDVVEQGGSSIEELREAAGVTGASADTSNEFEAKSTGPEHDSDWDLQVKETLDAIAKGSEDNEEEASEADSEQSDESSDEPKEEESSEDSEESGEKDEESNKQDSSEEESTKDSTKIEVKTKDGVLELTLDQIQSEHPEILQRLKNEISGEKEIARRFSDFDKEKKEFESERSEIEGYVAKFAESTKDGNILGGLTYFAEFANIPPYLLKEQLIASLRPEYEKRSTMSQDEINNVRLREENEFLVKKNESDHQARIEEQAKEAQLKADQDLQNQINSIRETHEITDNEWEEAYSALDKELPPEVEQIPLKAIQDKIMSNRTEAVTEQRLQTLVKPVSDKVNDKFVSELRMLIKSHPELTDESLNKVIADSLKINQKRELEETLKNKSLEHNKKNVKNDAGYSIEELKNFVDWD